MPLTGFTCEAPTANTGDTCSPKDCLQKCLGGTGCRPAPYIRSLINNTMKYRNPGTISGSALHKECYGQIVLERLCDYTQPTSNLHWATFRGQNVHDSLERDIKDDPDFEDWLVEERFYAVLTPDDEIHPAPWLADLCPNDDNDDDGWIPVTTAIHFLQGQGVIVLSGQVDTYDGKNMTLVDHKTAKWIREEVKESWKHQLNMYRFLLELHGVPVKKIIVNAMDSNRQVTLDVDLFDLNLWVPGFLIPKVRFINELYGYTDARDAYEYCNVSYLCNGENRSNTIYCPVAGECPAWQTYMDKKENQQ